MSLKTQTPQEEYITPEVQIYELSAEGCVLTGSNEGVGGKNDEDIPW